MRASHRVHGWKRVHSRKRVHGRKRIHKTLEKGQAELARHSVCVTKDIAVVRASQGAEPKCVRRRVHGQKRVHGRKRVHITIEKEQAELATCSACITGGRAKVCASRS